MLAGKHSGAPDVRWFDGQRWMRSDAPLAHPVKVWRRCPQGERLFAEDGDRVGKLWHRTADDQWQEVRLPLEAQVEELECDAAGRIWIKTYVVGNNTFEWWQKPAGGDWHRLELPGGLRGSAIRAVQPDGRDVWIRPQPDANGVTIYRTRPTRESGTRLATQHPYHRCPVVGSE
jgi:hypothetical protein